VEVKYGVVDLRKGIRIQLRSSNILREVTLMLFNDAQEQVNRESSETPISGRASLDIRLALLVDRLVSGDEEGST
jgi:hypothetical protein